MRLKPAEIQRQTSEMCRSVLKRPKGEDLSGSCARCRRLNLPLDLAVRREAPPAIERGSESYDLADNDDCGSLDLWHAAATRLGVDTIPVAPEWSPY